MTGLPVNGEDRPEDVAALRERLQEAEATLEAIRSGGVDAVVVFQDEPRVYTLEGADYAYRMVLNTMSEGVVTVARDLTIAYANRRFSDMVRMSSAAIVGGVLTRFLSAEGTQAVRALLGQTQPEEQFCEVDLLTADDAPVPVKISAAVVDTGSEPAFSLIVTDLSEQKRVERQLREHQRSLRHLVSELALTEERERSQLAAAVHDQVGQTLAFCRMKLSILLRDHSRATHAALGKIDQLLDAAIAEARSLTIELSPPVLYRLGLAAAIEWLAEEAAAKYGFQTTVRHDDQALPLGQDVRVILFAAVRELLVNAGKHAHAKAVEIEIESSPDSVRITVADDGVGFSPDAAPPGERQTFGLFHVSERLAYIGGSFTVETAPGSGSRFAMIAPMERRNARGDPDDQELCQPAASGAEPARTSSGSEP